MSPLVGVIVTSRDIAPEKDVLTHVTSLDPNGPASRAFAPLLGERGWGSIVHIAKSLSASCCPGLTDNIGKSASLGPWGQWQ